jgi:solute carrier family 25 (adenine nucleotide translocator) protein 4/5/6/31
MTTRAESLLQVTKDLSAGTVAAIASKSVAAPIERIKLLLQTQHINKSVKVPYSGLADCARRIYVEEGFFAFWRGNLANLYRYVPANAMNFAFKDAFRRLWRTIHIPRSVSAVPLCISFL